MRVEIIPASLNLCTITVNDVSNRYWPRRRLIEKVVYVEVPFDYGSH